MISLKEYAEQKRVSYEAIRQQVKRYSEELEGHIIKDGRQQFLDDIAVAFLDDRRQRSPVVIYNVTKDEELEALRQERESLLSKVATQANRIAELAEWKADNAAMIAEAKQTERLLNAAEVSASEAQQLVNELGAEKKVMQEHIDTLEADIKQAHVVVEEFRKEAQYHYNEHKDLAEKNGILQGRLNELAGAGFFKRKKIIKQLKKEGLL